MEFKYLLFHSLPVFVLCIFDQLGRLAFENCTEFFQGFGGDRLVVTDPVQGLIVHSLIG